ncbi:hypothetical protein L3476_20520 [Paenibacillus thiaminolyticus]|uniref:hypothetical protein n=1 Tax=Paenibacillus thiaminolyticus TaxID=49283 RepID=UPI001161D644|nr:hypothetical protein [Paenibacillus thiaminolyticus]MDG0873001.1 hypothetical protein [Paenibacillus thiaminolyticus]NGP60700.1 hypothetical protein [Paenibacillus thiaminolyticus]WCR25682.1 hypothetical protein L3476_20520 [Paenibacillus thiaminolyticus]
MNPRWAAASRNSKERLPLAHHRTNNGRDPREEDSCNDKQNNNIPQARKSRSCLEQEQPLREQLLARFISRGGARLLGSPSGQFAAIACV